MTLLESAEGGEIRNSRPLDLQADSLPNALWGQVFTGHRDPQKFEGSALFFHAGNDGK